jgi:hypothetical protein
MSFRSRFDRQRLLQHLRHRNGAVCLSWWCLCGADDRGCAQERCCHYWRYRAELPTCHTERDDLNARYCGVCAHDFETGRAGSIPTDLGQDVVVPQATTAVPVGTAAAASTSGARLDLTARVNESAANAPQGEPERKYNLIDEESLIGRASSSNGAAIGVVGDSAVSKRHAIITRHDDGSFTIRDAGSTNGTRLDGKDLTAHVEYPLAVGAVIELGEWTLLTVTAIKSA